jgi:hypothetical protein
MNSSTLITETEASPETSVHFYQTTVDQVSEDNIYHRRRCDNLKWHPAIPMLLLAASTP